MDRNYLKGLLQKYRDGRITPEERQLLIDYYELFQDLPDVMDALSAKEKEKLKGEIQSAVWDRIIHDQQSSGRVRFMARKMVRVAAAVLVLVFSAGILYWFAKPADIQQREMAVVQQPRENRVIFLPDGSKVILNGESKLNYPSTFEGLDKREVFLSGEAYFDIAHNEKMPFIVRTEKIETVVLGTAFNVQAYPEQENVIVTVTRGKVKVIDDTKKETIGIITQNEQIVYNKTKANSAQKTVDASIVVDWENRDLICDNVTLAETAQLLEDRFHVKTVIENPEIRSLRFTTTFPKDEKLESVLKSICVFNGLTYDYHKEDSTVVIKSKEQWK